MKNSILCYLAFAISICLLIYHRIFDKNIEGMITAGVFTIVFLNLAIAFKRQEDEG